VINDTDRISGARARVRSIMVVIDGKLTYPPVMLPHGYIYTPGILVSALSENPTSLIIGHVAGGDSTYIQ
jgi:hypothetical protein